VRADAPAGRGVEAAVELGLHAVATIGADEVSEA
jgi:hypothetical protein